MNFKKIRKDQIAIASILLLGFAIRFAAVLTQGAEYGLNSDDLSYVNAAITFVETGQITMHGVLSAQIMPGMIWLISPFVLLFGKGTVMWMVLKLFWISMGTLSMYGIYKTVKIYAKPVYAIIACLFFFAPDFIWGDTVILTETPFILSCVFLIYSSIQLAETKKWKYFYFICFWYMFALLLKANIAPYPLFLIVYLLFKKYDLKVLGKQIVIAMVITLSFIIPWTIRNYIQFDHFVPLTYGAGNPKLLGSYQGKYVPDDAQLDYDTNVYSKMSEEMRTYYNDDGSLKEYYNDDEVWEENYMAKYYSLELDDMKANYRIREWRKNNPLDYVYSILVSKPKILVYNSFYWKDGVFNIPVSVNYLFRKIDLLLFGVAIIGIILNKKRWKEGLFVFSFYLFQILVYAYTFAFERYAQSMFLFRFIIIGWGLFELITYIKNKKSKNNQDTLVSDS